MKRYRRGEEHPKVLASGASDKEVSLALELHAGGMSAAEIARKLERPERTVRNWVAGISRQQSLAANG